MGSDVFGIGITGLLAAQRSMATTGHNISNVNTEGYSRQRVDLGTQNPQYTGVGFFGRGVKIENVRRLYDEFLTTEIRDTTASLNQFDRFQKMAAQVDNLLADPQGSLSPALQGFFDAVQDVANDPASTPARQALLTKAATLSDRFAFFNAQIDSEYNNVNTQLTNLVNEVNNIAHAIADVNRSIVDVGGSQTGQVANDLLDKRDTLLQKLAELVDVKTVDQTDGSVIVFVGNGQVLVNQFDVQSMTMVDNEYDSSRKELAVTVGQYPVKISNQITGGQLGGVLDYRNNVLDSSRNSLGRIALALANDFNAQHRLGMDLNGQLGGDFFSVTGFGSSSIAALPRSSNTVSAGISITLSDTSSLTNSDYRLEYTGANRYQLTRLSDNTKTIIDTGGTYPYTSSAIDGFTVTIAGATGVGDSFLLQPTANAVDSFSVAITSTAKIAAAVPIHTSTDLGNTGTGIIDGGVLIDATAYIQDNYTIVAADVTAASAGGAVGVITDNNGDSTLQYDLLINGITVYSQTEGDTPLADLTALANAINGVGDANVALTGVRAYLDAAGTTLYLANDPASPVPITVEEQLNTSAGTIEDGDTVTGYFGSVLTGSSASATTLPAYPRVADSYVVVDSSGATVTSGAYTSGSAIVFNGIQVAISGTPNLGDTFGVDPNTSGAGDNRNMLALAALQNTGSLDSGTATYQEAYGALAADVGTKTNQAELNRDAQDALLNHTLAARSEVSGVNLDEEAVDMMRFQQLYQASARIISTADSMFQELIGILRR